MCNNNGVTLIIIFGSLRQKITNLRPSNHTRFEHHLGFRTEIFWFPENEISKSANSNLTNEVAYPIGNGAEKYRIPPFRREKIQTRKKKTYGLIVYLATYLLTLPLSFPSQSPRDTKGPLHSRNLLAVLQVRLITSPTRPIA